MATTEAAVLQDLGRHEHIRARAGHGIWTTAALTLLAVAVHGYHPYVEDGGVYLAGIKHTLDPQLYPAWTGFVSVHLHFSIFAAVVAWMVRALGLPLMVVMFAIYLSSTWLTLFSAWHLARRYSDSDEGRMGAVVLLTLMLTVPIAGTSLMLMDPYVTARSISTPCGLLALVLALDWIDDARTGLPTRWGRVLLCALCLIAACAVHPLMGGYAFVCVAVLGAVALRPRKLATTTVAAMCAFSLIMAGMLEYLWPPASRDYRMVAQTRSYWFLGNWHWYEAVGLIAPLALMGWFYRRSRTRNQAVRLTTLMAMVVGAAAIGVAFLFARQTSPAYLVARLQPLRVFQTIYVLMILLLGAYLGESLFKRRIWCWAVFGLALGGLMLWVQEQTFPHSAHVEWPMQAPSNPWERAFLWIRSNTPRDARFALDANYITAPEEDSQNFRAIADRSAMPDYAKDGGIASISPALTAQWMAGEAAQRGLDDNGIDGEKIISLLDQQIGWIVLPVHTRASLSCPYANEAVKVCRLEPQGLDGDLPVKRPAALSSR